MKIRFIILIILLVSIRVNAQVESLNTGCHFALENYDSLLLELIQVDTLYRYKSVNMLDSDRMTSKEISFYKFSFISKNQEQIVVFDAEKKNVFNGEYTFDNPIKMSKKDNWISFPFLTDFAFAEKNGRLLGCSGKWKNGTFKPNSSYVKVVASQPCIQ